PPEPRGLAGRAFQVLALEIDHGRFERELWFPVEVDPNRTTAERRDGWLWIHLPLKGGSR
ncbi:MAG: Hsp20/alpha crystallin family protein, partial [Verrucomicrobia bacterium]